MQTCSRPRSQRAFNCFKTVSEPGSSVQRTKHKGWLQLQRTRTNVIRTICLLLPTMAALTRQYAPVDRYIQYRADGLRRLRLLKPE
jgi:hypothetical protein